MLDKTEDAEEFDAKDETERHSTVLEVALPTQSSLRNVFRKARKVWGISMIKLVDFGTSFGTASVPEGTDEAVQQDALDEVSDENNDGEDEHGDGDNEEGEEETEEADEGEAEEEEVQGDEADRDGEQEIDLDEE